MSIALRLKQARKASKLTQLQLAVKTGLKQSTISDLEVGKSAGSTSIATLASALGVSALWLETGRGDQAKPDAAVRVREVPPALLPPTMRLACETIDELKILSMYRLASELERKAMIGLVNGIEERIALTAQNETQ